MNPFEFILFSIDLVWTANKQRKPLDTTKQALRDHTRQALNLDIVIKNPGWLPGLICPY